MLLTILVLATSVFFQPEQPSVQEDIWFLWIDTTVTVDGKKTRLVSKEPFKITCCVRSGKYTRLNKSAKKWIKDTYDKGFNADSPLKNIQDKSLAEMVISDARKDMENGANVLIVDYSDTCD